MKTKFLLLALAIGLTSACGNKTGIEKRKKELPFQADETTSTEALYNALQASETVLVREALKQGADINTILPNGDTPLTMAIIKRKSSLLNTLIEANPDIDMVNDKGESPLHIAIEIQDCYALRILVAAGADVNALNTWGNSALERAIAKGHTLGILTLMKAGAKLGDDPDDMLNLAQRNDLPVIERLIKDINDLESNLEKAALKEHVREGNHNFIEYLFKQENLNERANGNNLVATALANENQAGATNMLNVLLGGGLSPDGEKSDDMVPLIEAVKVGNEAALELLLAKGADTNKIDQEGLSPLAHAYEKLEDKMAKKLIDYQAKPVYSYKLGDAGYERDVCALLPDKGSFLFFTNMNKNQKEKRENLKKMLNCR